VDGLDSAGVAAASRRGCAGDGKRVARRGGAGALRQVRSFATRKQLARLRGCSCPDQGGLLSPSRVASQVRAAALLRLEGRRRRLPACAGGGWAQRLGTRRRGRRLASRAAQLRRRRCGRWALHTAPGALRHGLAVQLRHNRQAGVRHGLIYLCVGLSVVHGLRCMQGPCWAHVGQPVPCVAYCGRGSVCFMRRGSRLSGECSGVCSAPGPPPRILLEDFSHLHVLASPFLSGTHRTSSTTALPVGARWPCRRPPPWTTTPIATRPPPWTTTPIATRHQRRRQPRRQQQRRRLRQRTARGSPIGGQLRRRRPRVGGSRHRRQAPPVERRRRLSDAAGEGGAARLASPLPRRQAPDRSSCRWGCVMASKPEAPDPTS
jgi:hypothetical protein